MPVRLDNFNGEVKGLSNLLGYLSVKSNEPEKVVENFLRKIGKPGPQKPVDALVSSASRYVPNLKKPFSDREKNQFLREQYFGQFL